MDFGNGGSYISLIAARRGFRVLALDLEAQSFPWRHPDVQFLQSDLFAAPLSGDHFDVIINCSAVEHVGLAGRYGAVEQRVDGDSEAMTRLRALMKPGGAMLLTIPVGQDAVFPPLCRVYGERRLPLLLQDYSVEHEEFWVKDKENRWVPCNRDVALRWHLCVTAEVA